MNKNILDLGEFLKQKGEDDKRIQVIVSDELKEKISNHCRKNRITISNLIKALVLKYFKTLEEEKQNGKWVKGNL